MVVAPAATPPPARPSGVQSTKTPSPLKDSTSHNVPAAPPDTNDPKEHLCEQREGAKSDTELFARLNVPTVVLDASSVSHTMAASLSLSLLGHTLFLKSQVPFPVAQLMRMPGGGSNPKVAKKREELLATFDTLSSHLQTTFVALSTAHAKCKYAKRRAAAVPGDENSQKEIQSSATSPVGRGTAHLMFLLGPSVGAARARIILTIDGLDVKVWGERAQPPPTPEKSEDEGSIDIEDSEDEDDDDDEEQDQVETDEEASDALSDEDSVANSDEEPYDEEDELDELDSNDAASAPPASRSPSPSPPTRSLAPSPESPEILLNRLPTQFQPSPPVSAARPLPTLAPLSVSSAPTSVSASASTLASRQSSPTGSREPAPAASYAQEQAALRAAERLLSRTLMTAWADGGGDMASELAPTQTHVYLRAPRRFAHPAWVARQNLARTLDMVLDGYLVEAGAVPPPPGFKGKKGRGVRTEGAWVGCKGGSAFAAEQARKQEVENGDEEREGTNEEEEEDEEIWWAWDGKIVGFADW